VRIRIGRGHECEVQPVDAPESVVSRIHAELTVGTSGGLSVRDAGSKHGTFLNDEPVTTAVPVRLGDRITLGRGGPTLIVEGLGTAPEMRVARRLGDSRRRLGWLLAILLALALLLAGAVYGVYRLLPTRVE
jgi:pSer/pThr/pTyr-binding forkhead associated (FHA) protein